MVGGMPLGHPDSYSQRCKWNGESPLCGGGRVIRRYSPFEGGQTEARIRDELAKLWTQRERLRKLELQMQLEVETAAANVNSLQQRILTTEKSIEQAKESLEIEREKYEVGKSTITDVLDAQAALLEAQSIYYRTLADYETAKAQLRLAIGGKP
jgi:outer membrane protein